MLQAMLCGRFSKAWGGDLAEQRQVLWSDAEHGEAREQGPACGYTFQRLDHWDVSVDKGSIETEDEPQGRGGPPRSSCVVLCIAALR